MIDAIPILNSLPSPVEAATLHLLFRFESKLFAIAITKIEEVVQSSELNSVPGAAKTIAGIMNLRGEPLPVLATAELFGARIKSEGDSQHLIVVLSELGRFGLPVDKALKVLMLNPKKLAVDSLDECAVHSFVQTYAMDGDQTILLLEPDLMHQRSAA